MRLSILCALAACGMLAFSRADYISVEGFQGTDCEGFHNIVSMNLGCFLYNATAGIYGKVLCTNSNGTAGNFSLFTNSLCTTPAVPASIPVPLPPNTTLGTCHPGVPPADGTLTLCNQGDFVPETNPLGLTFTYHGSLGCGGNATTVANYPINRCSLGGPRATREFPYRMASCYNDTHYTVGSFSNAACTARGTTEFYSLDCSVVSGNATVYGKSSTQVCNSGFTPSPSPRASAAAATTAANMAVLLLGAAMVAKAW